MNDPIYVILHIHKCGGVSMTSHMLKFLKKGEYYGLYRGLFNQNQYFENRKFIKTYFSSLSKHQKEKIKIIAGHGAFYGLHKYFNRDIRYITFLRDPVKRTLSHYAYLKENTMLGKKIEKSLLNKGLTVGFNDWLKNNIKMHDYMTRYLYKAIFNRNIKGEVGNIQYAKVLSILNKFFQVGILDRPNDQAYLFSNLKIPAFAKKEHVTGKDYFPKSYSLKIIKKYMKYDLKLYDHFLVSPRPKFSFIQNFILGFRLFLSKYDQKSGL